MLLIYLYFGLGLGIGLHGIYDAHVNGAEGYLAESFQKHGILHQVLFVVYAIFFWLPMLLFVALIYPDDKAD